MTKVFFLGATGYVGGTVLRHITAAYPSLHITALARSPEKAALIAAAFPTISTVIGDLESAELLEAQAADADIVIHTAFCDIPVYARAVIRGLEKRGGGYFIHTSGTATISDEPAGTLSEKIWDDIADLGKLSSLPESVIHRPVEKIILSAPPPVHSAIISPGKIYGTGTGPDKLTTDFFRDALLAAGTGFTVGPGTNSSSTVHVQDLARLYTLLLGEALKPGGGGAAQWGAQGYYFGVSDQEVSASAHVQLQTRQLAASGALPSAEVQVWPPERAARLNPFYPLVFGSNLRARASRGKALGWAPVEETFEQWLERVYL